jgi:hypothetical protein
MPKLKQRRKKRNAAENREASLGWELTHRLRILGQFIQDMHPGGQLDGGVDRPGGDRLISGFPEKVH